MSSLAAQLNTFQTQLASVLNPLPEERPLEEIINRIFLIVVAPFAYLAYVLALACQTFFTGRAQVIQEREDLMTIGAEEALEKITDGLEKLHVKSAKVFIKLFPNNGGSPVTHIENLKKENGEDLDRTFFKPHIKRIVSELAREFPAGGVSKIEWDSYLLEENQTFHRCFGYRDHQGVGGATHNGLRTGEILDSQFRNTRQNFREDGPFITVNDSKAEFV